MEIERSDHHTRFFPYKNIVYKNIKAEICAKVKNMLRISPDLVEHTYRTNYRFLK